MSEKIHRGKLKTPPDATVVKHIIQPAMEADIQYRFQAFIDSNKAHVLMLAKQGIIEKNVAKAILVCNDEMAKMGDRPTFPIDPNREDFYFNIEAYLIDKVGIEIGGQQHTARSRNDLYAVCARISVRDAYLEICELFNELRQNILDVATKNTDAVFAGYTHMQPSEPITFAHYCSAVLNALERDFSRIEHCYAGLNICPLGGGSMGSTSWNIAPDFTAHLLGFDGPIDNSLDCVATRDYVTEILAALSIAAVTVSRFCQDLYIWASPDYGYIEVSDSCAVCSSIMPQKKNPWVLEHIKAKSAHIEGCFISAINVMKNVIYSHNEETSGEAANYLFNGLEEMKRICELTTVSCRGLIIKKDRMLERAKKNFCTVTELANYMVRKEKISFRTAHDIVAEVVAKTIDAGKTSDQIGLSTVAPIFEKYIGRPTVLTDTDIKSALDPQIIVEAKTSIGGTATEEVLRQLAIRKCAIVNDIHLTTSRVHRVAKARKLLNETVQKFIEA